MSVSARHLPELQGHVVGMLSNKSDYAAALGKMLLVNAWISTSSH